MKIVSSAKISEKHQQALKEKYPFVHFYFFDNMEQAVSEIKDTDVLITYGEDVDEKIISKAESLKWIQVVSAGVNKLPFYKLDKKDIIVTNAKGIHHIPMSEYTLSVILQLARKTNEFYMKQTNKEWDRSIRVSEINESTLGIIGLGSIGKGIVDKAKAFNMRVIGMNSDGRNVENVDKVYNSEQIHLLLSESDYVVVIVPLTDKTFNLIGAKELQKMKETAYLINISRGEVVNEADLIEALNKKQIGGAVLDVFNQEPLPIDHPFWSTENLIITPHVSGRSPHYMKRALEIFEENLEHYSNNNIHAMKNTIDLKKGY